MTAVEISTAMPAGWTWDLDEGRQVYVATCITRPELHFESGSPDDLLDQVHEALDAWQTELECRVARLGARLELAAIAAAPRVGAFIPGMQYPTCRREWEAEWGG